MSNVAEKIITDFESAMVQVENLNESIHINSESMRNISDLMGSTVEAIEHQADMCDDIKQVTDDTETQMLRSKPQEPGRLEKGLLLLPMKFVILLNKRVRLLK